MERDGVDEERQPDRGDAASDYTPVEALTDGQIDDLVELLRTNEWTRARSG